MDALCRTRRNIYVCFWLNVLFDEIIRLIKTIVLLEFLIKAHGDNLAYAAFFHGNAQHCARARNGFLVVRDDDIL